MIVLLPVAFAAGVITAFTPCILPVLPIILAGGAGAKRNPYAIAAGLVTTFTAFLLAGAWLWGLLGIGKQHQIQIGAVLLGVLALTLIIPRLGEWVERPLAFMTRRRFGDAGGVSVAFAVATASVGFFFRRRRLRRRERPDASFGWGRFPARAPATSSMVPSRSRAASINCVARGV